MTSAMSGEGRCGLPLRCHVVLPGLPAGATVAVCERGANGARMTSIDLGGFATPRPSTRCWSAVFVAGAAKWQTPTRCAPRCRAS